MIRIFNKFLLILSAILLFGVFVRFSPGTGYYEEYSVVNSKIDPPFITQSNHWIDSVFNSLTEEEKIAQLFMIAAYTAQNETHYQETEDLIKKYNIGGIIFFKGTPFRQAQLTNRFQAAAKTPLLIAIDGEWGLAMRIDSTVQYPRQMMLGAIQDDKMIYEMGTHIAMQMKRLGIHINFAPVADVNNNADNPVINSRSFGEDRYNVTRKSIHYMLGMQDNHILAVAKHFPGHGDTDADSHLKLPVISHDRDRLDSIELFPFRELVNSGIGGVMIAHLNVPALDSSKNQASTLSKLTVDSLLKQKMGFKGLVFTDAMNMGGITEHYKPADANTLAILAGNDIILMPAEIEKTISNIQKEIKRGTISQEEIDRRCKKIIAAKFWAGLDKYTPVNLNDLTKDLNKPEYRLFNQRLAEKSVTVLENRNDLLPLQNLDTLKIASVVFGDDKENEFDRMLGNYTSVRKFFVDKNAGFQDYLNLYDKLKDYNLVIIGLLGSDMKFSKNYGIAPGAVLFTDSIIKIKNTVIDLFANPYSLSMFSNLHSAAGVIVSYQNNEITQKTSAQMIFGIEPASGRLPVTAGGYLLRSGEPTIKLNRLKYSIPLEAGISEDMLYKVDSIALNAISEMATPGCQILAARNGVVFYMQSFGYPTYKSKVHVKNSDLYDLASVTKITASVPSLMKLYEEDKINLNDKISRYLPYLDTTNKSDLTVKDIMLHQSRLKPWIPFYLSTIEPIYPGQDLSNTKLSDTYALRLEKNFFVNKNLKFRDSCFSSKESETFSVQVAENLFMNKAYIDTIYKSIAISELNGREGYKYSDLGYYWFYRIIENLVHEKFEDFLDSVFYRPLGASSVCFRPALTHSLDEIMPTENDLVFRKQLVHGYVHDMGAAMMGGICGHAGLFANANDLAKIMQMYLNKGEYGNKRYLNKNTVELFTSCRDCNKNRRGLGFDKPEPDSRKINPVCEKASLSSFGHTGFTGTMIWADPDNNMVYIFLSNRIYPDATNNKLIEMNIRTKIQNVFYEAMIQ